MLKKQSKKYYVSALFSRFSITIAHYHSFCAVLQNDLCTFLVVLCKTFDFCTLLWFLCSFCNNPLFRFQHWLMVETVFLFYEIYFFLVLAFCFCWSWIFEVV